jgi:hypothetical protein
MLRLERYGRGGDVLLRELRLMDPGDGLSSSVIWAFYIRAWTVVQYFSLELVERVSSCFDLDGHCRFPVVYGIRCRRLGVYSGASGTVVDIWWGKGESRCFTVGTRLGCCCEWSCRIWCWASLLFCRWVYIYIYIYIYIYMFVYKSMCVHILPHHTTHTHTHTQRRGMSLPSVGYFKRSFHLQVPERFICRWRLSCYPVSNHCRTTGVTTYRFDIN